MLYREIEPPVELRRLVLSLWEFAVQDDLVSRISHEIFPDGCVSLFYIRNVKRDLHFAGLSGLYIDSVTKPLSAGDEIWGVRFSPAACSAILGVAAKTLVGRSTFNETEFPHLTGGLSEELRSISNFDEAVPVFVRRILPIKDPGSFDDSVETAVRLIDSSRGEIRVDEIAGHLGLSTRQFQRRFQASSGLSPKTYIRARRVRAAAIDLVEHRSNSWADRAAHLGFADQSHMAKELASITKRAPESFAKKIDGIEHGHLVK